MKPLVTILIPFFNEAENVNFLTESLSNYLRAQDRFNAEVIFINDGSNDDSVRLFQNQKNLNAKIISLSKNYGSHAALRAGIQNASGEYIVFMYADLQDPLELIDKLLSECLKGNEIAWAVRNSTVNSWAERKFSQAYSALMRKYAIPSYPEKGFDIVMFSRKIQQNLNSNIEANSSIFLQILTLGYKQTTIGYDKQGRIQGKSKWTYSKKVKLLVDSFVAFSFAPIRFVTIIGFLLFIIGILWTIYVVMRKVLVGDMMQGWPTLIAILFLGFGITNISLGIIAEYLWRTLDASRKRPVFIIDEIIELKNE